MPASLRSDTGRFAIGMSGRLGPESVDDFVGICTKSTPLNPRRTNHEI